MLARALVALTLLAVALSGCSDKEPAPVEALQPVAPGVTADVDGILSAAAPVWSVGESWDHHWYFGPQDTTGFTVKSIVVSNGTEGYRLATDSAHNAMSHAAFYFHDLGLMSPDWSIGDFGGAFQFPWYDFPLTDGKTWSMREENIDFDLQPLSQDLTMTARAINGTPGAFAIEARSAEGLRAAWDYQPDLGWFSEYKAFDPTNPDPAAFNVRMVNEAHGKGWTGTYYTATADALLNTFHHTVPTAPSAPPAPQSFVVTADHTHVMALVFAFAAGGAQAAELIAPDGQHWETYVVADPEGNALSAGGPGQWAVPAVPGEWRFAAAGAGAFVAGVGGYAWGITLAEGTL